MGTVWNITSVMPRRRDRNRGKTVSWLNWWLSGTHISEKTLLTAASVSPPGPESYGTQNCLFPLTEHKTRFKITTGQEYQSLQEDWFYFSTTPKGKRLDAAQKEPDMLARQLEPVLYFAIGSGALHAG